MLLSSFVALAASTFALGGGNMDLSYTEEAEYEGPETGPIFQGGCYADGANYEVEDVEDGQANTLGLVLTGAWSVVAPGPDTDSVDLDGSSLLANLSNGVTATMGFDIDVLGALPTDVGFMVTDSEGLAGISFDVVVVDGNGQTQTWTISGFGDADESASTDDDRFVSIFAASGVATVTLVGLHPIEIDHIQYTDGAAPKHTKGDLDKSGTGDLLIQKPGNSVGSWLLDDTDEVEDDYINGNGGGDGEGENENEVEDETSGNWTLAGSADLDNDCDADMVWRNGNQVKVWIMENGAPADKVVIDDSFSATWDILAVDDFDGNGTADILVGKPASEKLRVWSMNGSTVTSNKAVAMGSFKLAKHALVTTGDINGDGKADIVWRRVSDGDVRGWAMNGSTIEQSSLIANDYSKTWEAVGGGDINGDGVTDVVFRSKSSGKVRLCCLKDDFSIEDQSTYEGITNSSLAACTDIDGNGCDDLVWRKETSTGKLVRWAMSPSGPSSSKTIGYVGNTSVRVYGSK